MPDMKTLDINGVVYTIHDPETVRVVESTEYPGCYYRMADDEQEWLNPPLVPGIEYRTMERYNNKPVYIKQVGPIHMHSNQTASISYCEDIGIITPIAIQVLNMIQHKSGDYDYVVGFPPFIKYAYAKNNDDTGESYVVVQTDSFEGTDYANFDNPDDPLAPVTIVRAIVKYTKFLY